METKVISIINNKGGVGKTMTAQNLSAALAAKGKKVCMIDFDSQHNLTNRCENERRTNKRLVEKNYEGVCIEDYLTNAEVEIEPQFVKYNLYLIPSSIRLSELSAKLYTLPTKENPGDKLKEFCDCLKGHFDFIVVDSEPGMSALMVNAARAADLIIIPVCNQDSLTGANEGVIGILENNHLSTPYYFLQSMFENRLRIHNDIRELLIEECGDNTFKTVIHKNEWLNNAGNDGIDIFEKNAKMSCAVEYKCLAGEVVRMMK